MVSSENTELPHRLELVIDYVNTLDVDQDSDSIDTPASLATWLAARGLLAGRAPRVSQEQYAAALRLREALRALMLANNGETADSRAGEELERVARAGGLGVHFDADCAVTMEPSQGGFEGALARLITPIAAAADDGTWRRAKACRADDCMWAFYDRSRNRSGVWCDMAVCGNRTKVRTYRNRRGHD
jgi:predicted RNA-binding Zn ribbon-like protein